MIAIIGILAAMLLPALSKARDKAKATGCISNMKQAYTSARMYLNDHKDYWPVINSPESSASYFAALYKESIVKCRSDWYYYDLKEWHCPNLPFKMECKGSDRPQIYGSFYNNSSSLSADGRFGLHLSASSLEIGAYEYLNSDSDYKWLTNLHASPSYRVIFSDASRFYNNKKIAGNRFLGGSTTLDYFSFPDEALHNGKLHLAYLSGNVDSISPQKITSYFTIRGGGPYSPRLQKMHYYRKLGTTDATITNVE